MTSTNLGCFAGGSSKLGPCYLLDVFFELLSQIEIDCCFIPINCIPIGW